MSSICRFVPNKNGNGDIKTVHFVYETEFKKLKQPFQRPMYCVSLVTLGEGVLRMAGCEYKLDTGTLFFSFPGEAYEIEASDDFEYIYISFMGSYARELLDNFGIDGESAIYHNFTHTDLWYDAIRSITPLNSNILTERVLYYTLSIIQSEHASIVNSAGKQPLAELLTDYINVHYREHDISLGKMSEIFSYTEKYLSAFFKKHMKIRFTEYLNTLRIQYAIGLMNSGQFTIAQISSMCGYTDSLYFSKVFKRHIGQSPSDYIRVKNNNQQDLAGGNQNVD